MGKVKHSQGGLTVFISGPYSEPDVAANVKEAIDIADQILCLGLYPFIPHLSHFWDIVYHHEYDEWMDLDSAWLMRSDCVFRLPGKSEGADAEIRLAQKLGIPVFYGLDELEMFREKSLWN